MVNGQWSIAAAFPQTSHHSSPTRHIHPIFLEEFYCILRFACIWRYWIWIKLSLKEPLWVYAAHLVAATWKSLKKNQLPGIL